MLRLQLLALDGEDKGRGDLRFSKHLHLDFSPSRGKKQFEASPNGTLRGSPGNLEP